jgi:hypothetical protein
MQYAYRHEHWDLVEICDWGGWSGSQTNTTIMKYLIGIYDDRPRDRRDYLNPEARKDRICFAYKRPF